MAPKSVVGQNSGVNRPKTWLASPSPLTFDATLHNMLLSNGLDAYEPRLRFGTLAWRFVYGSKRFVDWIGNTLPGMTSSSKSRGSPQSQVEAVLAAFCDGGGFSYGSQIKPLDPLQKDVWELKTPDVRLMGWFPVKNHFLIDVGKDSTWLHKDLKRYDLLVAEIAEFRKSLGFILPGPVKSKVLADVISNRTQ